MYIHICNMYVYVSMSCILYLCLDVSRSPPRALLSGSGSAASSRRPTSASTWKRTPFERSFTVRQKAAWPVPSEKSQRTNSPYLREERLRQGKLYRLTESRYSKTEIVVNSKTDIYAMYSKEILYNTIYTDVIYYIYCIYTIIQ